jgi:cell division control protein 6
MEGSRIFKNESVLSYEYLPEIFYHRDSQIKVISENLSFLMKGRKPNNIFIFGLPGVGKTATVKFVFREFENYSGIKTIYINCWEYNTSTAILSKITQELGYPVPRHGWSKDEIMEKLIEMLNKSYNSLVICLDEVDQLIYKDYSALYDLTRINQFSNKQPMLIFISNNKHIFAKVDPRIKSSLNLEEIEFKPYNLLEMKDIIKQRTDLAFFSVEQGVVLLVANTVLNFDGDVRVGLDCLLKAGRLAEEENADKLKVSHVKQSIVKLVKVKRELLKERVSENEKIILKILEDGKEYTSSELYLAYCKEAKNAVTERMFTNYINHLASLNLISVRRKENVHGFTRVISKVD